MALESAESAFTESGELTAETIQGSKLIIPSDKLINPEIPAGFSKFTTETFQSPSGPFQVHSYMNEGGEVSYSMDYKAVFNSNGVAPFTPYGGNAR